MTIGHEGGNRSAAMAVGCALLGLVIGFVLEYFRDTPRDPLD